MDNLRRQSALGKYRIGSFLPTCSVCGRRFEAEKMAEYCSSRCRAKAWRARRKAEQTAG